MFETVSEFIELVLNYTTRPEFEQKRLAIVRRAQAMALRKFTWAHVADTLERALHDATRMFLPSLLATTHVAPTDLPTSSRSTSSTSDVKPVYRYRPPEMVALRTGTDPTETLRLNAGIFDFES